MEALTTIVGFVSPRGESCDPLLLTLLYILLDSVAAATGVETGTGVVLAVVEGGLYIYQFVACRKRFLCRLE